MVPAESLDLAIEAEGAGGDAAAAAGFSLGGLTPVDGEAEGAYVAKYSVRRVGSYALHVRLRGTGDSLAGSPFSLRVRAADAHAPTTELPPAAGAIRTSAGALDSVYVQALDRYANACAEGGAQFTAEVVPTGGGGGGMPHGVGVGGVPSAELKVSVRDAGDGTYEVHWYGEAAGTHRLSVYLRGAHVGGSPTSLRVLSARPEPRACALGGDGLRAAVAGQEALVTLRCRDAYGGYRIMGQVSQVRGRCSLGLQGAKPGGCPVT